MSQKYTKKPWKVSKDGLAAIEPGTDIEIITGYISDCTDDEVRSAIKRAVACVNALAGLNPEAIPGLVEAGQTLCDSLQAIWDDTPETELSLDLGRRVVLAREKWYTALAAAKKVEGQ